MKVLDEKEIQEKLAGFSGWKFNSGQIEKEFALKDFKAALKFVIGIGVEAEKADHHPDIFLHSWNKVKVTLSTHSAGGVTEKDFNLAKTIEENL